MIKSVKIKNFQSHRKTFLEFDKGVNVIVGATDSGKSAIIRALRWLVWNRPTGDAFCSTWGGNTHVSVETETHKIARNKGKENNYVVQQNNEEPIEFKAFGTGTPTEVQEVLNINEINLQQQLDKPFLLSDSPGQVAGFFNKIAGIDLIDSSIKSIQKEIRATTQNIVSLKGILDDETEELKKYDNLDTIETEIERLEKLKRKEVGLVRRGRELFALVYNLKEIDEEIAEINKLRKYEKRVDSLIAKIEQRNILLAKRNGLNFLISKYEKQGEKLAEYGKLMALDKQLTPILQNIAKKGLLQGKLATLKGWVGKYNRLTDSITQTGLKQAELNKQYSEIEICPFCGTKLK